MNALNLVSVRALIVNMKLWVKLYIYTRMHTHFSYRFSLISNDFDVHFRCKSISIKISSSPPTSLGTCGNAGFIGGEGKLVFYAKNKVLESVI